MAQKLRAAEIKIKDLTFNNEMFKTSNDMGRAELNKRSNYRDLKERLAWAERSGNVDSTSTELLRLQAALRKENQGLRYQVHGSISIKAIKPSPSSLVSAAALQHHMSASFVPTRAMSLTLRMWRRGGVESEL